MNLFSLANTGQPVERPVMDIHAGSHPSLRESGPPGCGQAINPPERVEMASREQQPSHKQTTLDNLSQDAGPQQSPPSLGTEASFVDARATMGETSEEVAVENSGNEARRWHYVHFTQQELGPVDKTIWIPYIFLPRN